MRLVYDEISPWSGELSVMVEFDSVKQDNVKLCMDTGYQTYEKHWKVDSPSIEILEAQQPKIITDTKKIDAGGNVWYKISLVTPLVVLMPTRS